MEATYTKKESKCTSKTGEKHSREGNSRAPKKAMPREKREAKKAKKQEKTQNTLIP